MSEKSVRVIKVTGKSKISVKPDTVRLLITQTDIKKVYEDAVKESVDQKNALTEALQKQGFKKTDLKTLNFNVNTEYESYQDKNKAWKQRLKGYRFIHSMKLEFTVKSEKLGAVLQALTKSKGNPEFTIQYTIANTEKAKNELLKKAVEDSRAKAEVLAKASGVTLGDISAIDYSFSEVEFVVRPLDGPMMRNCLATAKEDVSYAPDIEPEDIDVTDTVTIAWEIK